MARGMANGESINSQANTDAFREGFERVFGERKAKPGRYVFDEVQQKFVPAEEYQPPVEAKDAPIMAGRFYENLRTTDGTPINSRRQHQAFMKEKGLAVISDYKNHLEQKAHEREKMLKGDFDHKARREAVGRAWYEAEKKRR